MTTEQTTTERLAEAVEIILAYAPDWATTKTGKAVEKILREALAAHEAQRGQSFMDWFTRTAGGDMNMEHCERAWKAAIASQPSLEREALDTLRLWRTGWGSLRADERKHFIVACNHTHAVLAKAERKGQ